MKFMQKKYPLLISAIVSCVIIIASLFVLGFCGLKLSVSLGGGSRFEVNISSEQNISESKKSISKVLKNHGMSIDSAFVEDKITAGQGETEYVRQCLVIQIAKKGISNEERNQIKDEVVKSLNTETIYVSTIEEITPSVKAKDVLFIALAVGIIAVCFFVFGWVRYDLFAGISFIISFLHNIILYLSFIILTRVQLSPISLIIALILTMIMSVMLINLYEKYRETSKLETSEKTTVVERMLACEKQVIKPYVIVLVATLIVVLMLLFVPSNLVKIASLSGVFAVLVTAYTSLIIGPASYTALLEIREMSQKARLSRNDTINKSIKKKIKKNSKNVK